MSNNPRNGGPTVIGGQQMTVGQALGLAGVIPPNIPKDTSGPVAQYWINNGGVLGKRLRTLRYRPARMYCGNWGSQFDEDWAMFGNLANNLEDEGLIVKVDEFSDPNQELDILLTKNAQILKRFHDAQRFQGVFWSETGSLEGSLSFFNLTNGFNWREIRSTIFNISQDIEWYIRRLIHEMRNRLMFV